MSMQGVKCFNCWKKGHIATKCPEPPRKNDKSSESTRRIESGKEIEAVENPNPWILTVTTELSNPLGSSREKHKLGN